MRDITKASDLIISVLAFNPQCNAAVIGEGIRHQVLVDKILKAYPDPAFEYAGIRLHPIHGDSECLDEALKNLHRTAVLTLWVPGNCYTWNFPLLPQTYFRQIIEPELSDEQKYVLQHFSASLNC